MINISPHYINTALFFRAIPSSGKTTISNAITDFFRERGINPYVCSTDYYFTAPDGRYHFDITRLGEYHQRTLVRFERGLQRSEPLVVCDNTNIVPWQLQPYSQLARKYGYPIILMTFEPRTLELHIEAQRITPQKPFAHGVPADVMKRFFEEYYIYNDLLNPDTPVDPQKYLQYGWDDVECKRMLVDAPCPHFDYDYLHVVKADNFDEQKAQIGKLVYDLCLAEK